jgi:hypothetical protein
MKIQFENSLFSSRVLARVCSDILGADPTSAGCAVTAKGACPKAVWGREGELLVPGAGRVYGERRDWEARGRLAMWRYENRMWMSAVPWRGCRAHTASLGTGRACRAAVCGGRFGSSGRARTRTGPSIGGLGAGVVDGVVICGWRGVACIVSKR